MDRYTIFVATKRAMYEAFRIALTSKTRQAPQTRARIRASVAKFVSAGTVDGTIRDDVAPDDITVNLAGIVLMTTATDQDQLRRLLDLLMDGLRPRQ